MKMGLREANQQFSKAVKAVKAGEDVVLTERGKPIAVIKPLPQDNRESGVLRRLEAEGVLRPAAVSSPMPRWRRRVIRGEPISRTLRRERDES